MAFKRNDLILNILPVLLFSSWIGTTTAEVIIASALEVPSFTVHLCIVHCVYHIYFDQTQQNQNKSISCSGNSECKIYCKEEDACRDTTIYCPVNQRCLVSCGKGSNACHGATIDARYSTLFALNDCYTGDETTCGSMTIFFPPNLDGVKRAFLSTGDNFKTNLTFYAIYGIAP